MPSAIANDQKSSTSEPSTIVRFKKAHVSARVSFQSCRKERPGGICDMWKLKFVAAQCTATFRFCIRIFFFSFPRDAVGLFPSIVPLLFKLLFVFVIL